jgi:AraC family transcriptional regulator
MSPSLCGTAVKLRAEAASLDALYAEALGTVLAHELIRLNDGRAPAEPMRRGGLAAAEQYIEEHLAEAISLASLAELARLSPFHFARAFKQSYAMPPHRFHSMRIERAKALLSLPALPVTEIAMRLGFSDTSSFSTTFRKITGRTPSDFRRSLI